MILWADHALLSDGWQRGVRVEIAGDRIAGVTADAPPEGHRVDVLLPAPANAHSHGFQRAMAGLTEHRGPDPRDTFWTWRALMYRFLDQLTPDDIEAITAFAQMQMLEAGYAAVAEFHYVHHQPGGIAYDRLSELSDRIAAAASETGIGLTLVPVLYEAGGCDGRALQGGQQRFGNTIDRFTHLLSECEATLRDLPDDTRLGVAAHSLRAVSRDSLAALPTLIPDAPLHMHLAEQQAEVDEIEAAYGARPVDWLLENAEIDARWTLIHCTQMQHAETTSLARTGAVACLCPITESSLGDGIFDGVRYADTGGRLAIGSDSNIRIALAEELRTLEYSQRLRDRTRAALATPRHSTGRRLYDMASAGGAQATGRDAGRIEAGALADLLSFDATGVDLLGREGDALLDGWIFAADDSLVQDVWSAGRHVVKDGQHIRCEAITDRYRTTLGRFV